MQVLELKRGSSLSQIFEIPASYADGFFATGWQIYCQAVDPATGEVIADLEPQWVNPTTTRSVQVVEHATAEWPVAVLVDVIFRRVSDGLVVSTGTVLIKTERRVSRVPA